MVISGHSSFYVSGVLQYASKCGRVGPLYRPGSLCWKAPTLIHPAFQHFRDEVWQDVSSSFKERFLGWVKGLPSRSTWCGYPHVSKRGRLVSCCGINGNWHNVNSCQFSPVSGPIAVHRKMKSCEFSLKLCRMSNCMIKFLQLYWVVWMKHCAIVLNGMELHRICHIWSDCAKFQNAFPDIVSK